MYWRKNHMDHDMTNYLDSIHASERLKRKTKAYLRHKTFDYGRDTMRMRSSRIRTAGCIAAAVITFAGIGLYRLPTAYIDLDINPSMELNINALGRVISLNGLNDDGAELARVLNVSGMSYGDAMQYILISDPLEPYLEAGSSISISVTGSSVQQSETILKDVVCRAYGIADKENVYYCHADRQTAREAKNSGLSLARYQALEELRKTDPTVTPEYVQDMSMSEICSLIRSHQLDDPCQ